MRTKSVLVGLVGLFASAQIFAQDLGVIGKTYVIAEQDAVEQIQAKLKNMEASGELAKIEKQAIQKSLHSLKNPKANELTKATKRIDKLFDPTQVIEHEVRAEDGTLIAPAGTRINPLEHMTLSKSLLFFDGRDKEQVNAAKAMIAKHGAKVMPVLTAGSWYDLSKSWRRQIYYDQGGYMIAKLNIEQVPALVTQQGQQLRISYIPAKEL